MKTLETAIGSEMAARLQAFCGSDHLPGRPAVVIGFGWIGQLVAEYLQSMGREVVVVDPSAEARQRAEAQGFAALATPDRVLGEAAIIAGCTGERTLTAAQLQKLTQGPVLFSASSSNREFELPSDCRFHEDMLVRGPGYHYTVLGAGFPINFTGGATLNPPERMQFVMAALAAGVVSAATRLVHPHREPPRVQSLDRGLDDAIVTMARHAGVVP